MGEPADGISLCFSKRICEVEYGVKGFNKHLYQLGTDTWKVRTGKEGCNQILAL